MQHANVTREMAKECGNMWIRASFSDLKPELTVTTAMQVLQEFFLNECSEIIILQISWIRAWIL